MKASHTTPVKLYMVTLADGSLVQQNHHALSVAVFETVRTLLFRGNRYEIKI